MGTAEFPVSRIHAVTAASCTTWVVVNIIAHIVTCGLWRGYGRLSFKDKLGWCNRITSALHAAVLVCGQARNLSDPHLHADPLYAVSDGHFFWGSVMYGYLLYDSAYTLLFYSAVGSPSFVIHHALGLVCCCFGLYFNKLALFGMAIQVFFEGTTPLLHVLGCLKIAGRDKSPAYVAAGLAFALQFLASRVVIGNYYGWLMLRTVAAQHPTPVFGVCGCVVYAMLSALNLYWFSRLVGVIAAKLRRPSKRVPRCASSAAAPLPPGVACVLAPQLATGNSHLVHRGVTASIMLGSAGKTAAKVP